MKSNHEQQASGDCSSERRIFFSKDNKFLKEQVESACIIDILECTGEVPPPRNDHRVFIRDKKLTLVGGTTDKGSTFSTFVLDLQTYVWKEVKVAEKSEEKRPVSGMGVTVLPSSLYSHHKGFALMYGGWTGAQYSSDLYLVNLNTMQTKPLPKQSQFKTNQAKQPRLRPAVSIGNSKEIEKYQTSQYPPARKQCTLSYIASENKICLYGGWEGEFNTGSKEQLWILSNTWKWQKFLGVNRRGHTSVVIDDSRGNGFLVFGGFKGIKVVCNQSLFFDLKNKKWSDIQIKEDQIAPPGRAYHTANVMGNKIIYIGGVDDNYRIFQDIWIFCMDKRTWNKIILPMKHRALTRRAGHATFTAGSRLYIIGGMTLQLDKKQYIRVPLKEMICLDFRRIIQQSGTAPQRQRTAASIHNTDHHWDIQQFGFSRPKREDLQDLYNQLQGVGITDNEL